MIASYTEYMHWTYEGGWIKSLVVFCYFRHYDKYKMKFRTCIKVARHNMNLLENSQSTICFFSGKAPGHIWPVLGLEIYRRERIELSMSIDSNDSDDCN